MYIPKVLDKSSVSQVFDTGPTSFLCQKTGSVLSFFLQYKFLFFIK